MKILLSLTIYFNLLLSAHAAKMEIEDGPGNGAGGGHLLSVKSDNIVAVTTKDGDYARIRDLKDGFVKFKGVSVYDDKIIFDLKNPKFNIESIITEE